jgi:hypothetical protein
VPAFITGLSGTLLEIVFKLRQHIIPLQKVQVMNNLGRLVLIASLLIIFPWAFIAILAAGIPQIWANRRLRNDSMAHVNWQQKPDPAVRKEIMLIVKRALPGASLLLFIRANYHLAHFCIWQLNSYSTDGRPRPVGHGAKRFHGIVQYAGFTAVCKAAPKQGNFAETISQHHVRLTATDAFNYGLHLAIPVRNALDIGQKLFRTEYRVTTIRSRQLPGVCYGVRPIYWGPPGDGIFIPDFLLQLVSVQLSLAPW